MLKHTGQRYRLYMSVQRGPERCRRCQSQRLGSPLLAAPVYFCRHSGAYGALQGHSSIGTHSQILRLKAGQALNR